MFDEGDVLGDRCVAKVDATRGGDVAVDGGVVVVGTVVAGEMGLFFVLTDRGWTLEEADAVS